MNRRHALALLSAFPFLGWHPPRVYGYMDVDRWFREGFYQCNAKVLLDGVDITYGLRWFDDSTGVAECLKYGRDGQPYLENGDVAVETKRGRIEVVDPPLHSREGASPGPGIRRSVS